MPDLRPCPFCGGEPMIYDIEPHKHYLVKLPDYPGSTVIECGCGCGRIDESRETVIARWNTRSDSAAVAAEREAIMAVIDAKLSAAADFGVNGSLMHGYVASAFSQVLCSIKDAIRARGAPGGPVL